MRLDSEGVTGHVVAGAVGWCGGALPRMQVSFFTRFSPYDPVWRSGPLWGVGGESTVASPQQVAEALLGGLPADERRERHRHVHLLMAKVEQDGRRGWHNLGVFLTEEDAQEAMRLIEPHVAVCGIENVPVVF